MISISLFESLTSNSEFDKPSISHIPEGRVPTPDCMPCDKITSWQNSLSWRHDSKG